MQFHSSNAFLLSLRQPWRVMFPLTVWFSKQQLRGGKLRGEGQGGERVHDEVDPQHLHGLQGAVLDGAGPGEGHHHRHHIHRQLELEELRDGVVHVSAPHHRLHDAGEVVVGKDDVGGLLCHVCSGNPHCEADICLLESGGVIRAVPGHCHHLAPGGECAVDDS